MEQGVEDRRGGWLCSEERGSGRGRGGRLPLGNSNNTMMSTAAMSAPVESGIPSPSTNKPTLGSSSTVATWAYTSCSSLTTKTPSCSSSQSQNRRLVSFSDEEEETTPSRDDLSRRCKLYHDGCRLFDKRRTQRQTELLGSHSHFAAMIESLALPLSHSFQRQVLTKYAEVGTIAGDSSQVPWYERKLPARSPSSNRLRSEARRQEISSEAIQKPPGRKYRSPFSNRNNSIFDQAPPTTTNISMTTMVSSSSAGELHTATGDDSTSGILGLGPQEVRQQQQILDEIQQRRRGTTPLAPPAAFKTKSPPRSTESSHGNNEVLQSATTIAQNCRLPQQFTAAALPAPARPMVVDQVTHLNNGTKVHIQGTNHTYKSIAQGEATLVQCPSCRYVLQIGRSAKMLYCAACEQVSPIATTTTTHSVTSAAGTATMTATTMNAGDITWDDQIAFALAWQEISAGRALKELEAKQT